MCEFIPTPCKQIIAIDVAITPKRAALRFFKPVNDTCLCGFEFDLHATTLEALAIEFQMITGFQPLRIEYPPEWFPCVNSSQTPF